MTMASVCLIIITALLMVTCPFSERLGAEAIRGGWAQRTNILHFFICTELVIPVCRRLVFRMAELVVYGPLGANFWTSSMHEYFLFGGFPHTTQSLVYQRYIHGSGYGKDGVCTATGKSRGFRECYVITSVTPKEGGIHVRSFSTGISSQLNQIRSCVIMGSWMTWKVYLRILIPKMNLVINI